MKIIPSNEEISPPSPTVNGGQEVTPSRRHFTKELVTMRNGTTATTGTLSKLPPKFSRHLVDIEGIEGDIVELLVTVKDADEILWLKNNKLIPNSPYFQYIGVGDSSSQDFKLVIKDPFEQDSGVYSCRAWNQYGENVTFAEVRIYEARAPNGIAMNNGTEMESKVTMTTTEKPDDDKRHDSGIIAGLPSDEEPTPSVSMTRRVTTSSTGTGKAPMIIGPTFLIGLKGEQVWLRLKYSGIPQAKVEWSKNGKEFSQGDILDNGELTAMRIPTVSYDHSGRYVARATNDHGTAAHYCFLAVEGPPLPPTAPPTTSLLPGTTRSVTISWSGLPYDGGSALLAYLVQVSVDEGPWTNLAEANSLTYILTSAKPGVSYRFRVGCQNLYGLGDMTDPSVPIVLLDTMESNPGFDLGSEILLEFPDVHPRRGFLEEFYTKGDVLGKGRFGTVFNVQEKRIGGNFAAKVVRCIKVSDKVKVRQEVEIMNALRHPTLLQIIDALENDKEICLITEKIYGGELFERVVAEDEPLTEFDCIGFMRQICDGVRFMHEKNIIHLDLKPENILCLTHSSYNIKIIDFGLSQRYDSSNPLRVLFGTPEFISPEIINYEPISPASDIWALGVITYVLLSGLSPFMGDTDADTFSNISQGHYDFDDDSFDSISDDAKDFISALLIRRQEKRLTAFQCLDHKWLAYPEPKKNIVIPKLNFDKLRKFLIRRKWQKTGNAIRALGRMTNLSRKSASSDQSPVGSPKNESWTKPESTSLDEEVFTDDDASSSEIQKFRQLQRQQCIERDF